VGPKPDLSQLEQAKRDAVIEFLTVTLAWLDDTCREWHVAADQGGKWERNQYAYWKTYRSNVKHMLEVAKARGRRKRKTDPNRKG
jgi:hypothetical protein